MSGSLCRLGDDLLLVGLDHCRRLVGRRIQINVLLRVGDGIVADNELEQVGKCIGHANSPAPCAVGCHGRQVRRVAIIRSPRSLIRDGSLTATR